MTPISEFHQIPYTLLVLFIWLFFIVGVHGPDGDGDVYNPDNLREFQNFVHAHTDGKGVHFVMADGVCCAALFNWLQFYIFCIIWN